MARILIADDEPPLRRILSVILKDGGHAVAEAGTVAEARTALTSRQFDLLATDQRMPDGDGLSLLATCREADPTLSVVVITAYATVELAVAAMREGAFDVLAKPFDPGTVLAVVGRACEHTRLLRENERLKGAVRRFGERGPLVGTSPAIRRVRELIARVAPTHATVLITGETGTGKELVARAIHEASPRADGPFVPVNCAAFTETLLESELFGHERGAFTGAERSRQGLFEAAHGGTLFLDEAGEMSLALQAKLLRVLMDGEVFRIGTTVPRTVDVRIVAATHRDLRQRVRDQQFREDLYYRIAVVPVDVPPLRAHLEDVPVLLDHFLARAAVDLKVPPCSVCPEGVEKLRRYSFPGNVRELRNLVERACVLAKGPRIGAEDFPVDVGASAGQVPDDPVASARRAWLAALPQALELKQVMDETESALLRRALESSGGVQAEAARRLGISRSDMAYKVRKHALTDGPAS